MAAYVHLHREEPLADHHVIVQENELTILRDYSQRYPSGPVMVCQVVTDPVGITLKYQDFGDDYQSPDDLLQVIFEFLLTEEHALDDSAPDSPN